MPPKAAGRLSPKRPGSKGKGGKKGSKKGSKKGKKKKAKIDEDPKLVRELVTAAESGELGKLKTLMETEDNKKKFDLQADAGEALVRSAEKGQLETVSYLLESGCKPSYGQSKSLHRSCIMNHFTVFRLLIDFGGDVNAKAAMTDYTPLHHAAQHGHTQLVRYLVEQGATLDVPSNAHNCLTYNGWSPLHFADNGHLEVVKLLLDNGAEIDIPNSTQETACSIAAERGQFHVVRHLIAYGADIHAKRRELSIVQWAIYRSDHEAVQYLVSHGADADLTVQTKWFPAGKTLNDVIKAELSKALYDRIDTAIYRGAVGLRERASHRRLLSELRWECLVPPDPLSFEAPPPPDILALPPHIVNLVSSYEM